MKKIVFITDKVYPFFIGGQEKIVFEHSQLLIKKGNKVSIFSMKWWPGRKNEVIGGIEYISYFSKLNLYKKNGKRKIINNLIFSFSVLIFCLKTDADIISFIIFPYFPVIFAKIAKYISRKKFLIVGYWLEYLDYNYWKGYYKFMGWSGILLQKNCLKCCDYNISISEFTKEKIIRGTSDRKINITVLPPVQINFERLDNIEVTEKKYDIVYFGRLIFHKHVEKILYLVKKLKIKNCKIKVVIIGEGPAREFLENEIIKLGLEENVLIINFFKNYNDLFKKIKSAKIMVFPSEREGFGMAVIEANACGLPVLVLDYPQNASLSLIEDEKNGYICKNDDVLLKKTEFILSANNHNIIKNMSLASYAMAKKYDKDIVEKLIYSFYNNL